MPPRAPRLEPRLARLGRRARRAPRAPARLRPAGRRGDRGTCSCSGSPSRPGDRRLRDRRALAQPDGGRPAVHGHFAARETFDGLLALELRGSPHFAGPFGDWFPLSLLLLGIAATAWIVAGWLAPWRHRVVQAERERELARALVHTWGVDTLAPFVLRADKSYFFADDESAFLAYRVVGGVAIVSGDPVGPRERLHDVLAGASSRMHARATGGSRSWERPSVGCRSTRRTGSTRSTTATKAIVETATFSLEGRGDPQGPPVGAPAWRTPASRARAAPERARRPAAGRAREPSRRPGAAQQPERGFVMALDALFSLGDEDAVFVVGFDPAGHAAGFLHFALSPASPVALALVDAAPAHDAERLQRVADLRGVAWARAAGYERVSLNFAPFAALLAPEAELTGMQELQRRALRALKGHFQLDNLLAVQPQVLPALGAALRRLRAPARPAARRHRRARGRGVPAVPGRAAVTPPRAWCSRSPPRSRSTGVGSRSTAPRRELPALSLRAPSARCAAVSATAPGSSASSSGVGGWVFYVAALALAPLSLVQAASAGGIGLLAVLAHGAATDSPAASGSPSASPSWASCCSPYRSPAAPRAAARRRRRARLLAGALRAARTLAAVALIDRAGRRARDCGGAPLCGRRRRDEGRPSSAARGCCSFPSCSRPRARVRRAAARLPARRRARDRRHRDAAHECAADRGRPRALRRALAGGALGDRLVAFVLVVVAAGLLARPEGEPRPVLPVPITEAATRA